MQVPIELRLARHGVIVVLLGLLVGFVIPKFQDRHLGDAAHLVGLIGGYGMIALSVLWPRLILGRLWSIAGVWMTALSMYLSWLGLVLKGRFVIEGAGQAALVVGAWLALFATIVVLAGLRKVTARTETEGAMAATVATKPA